MNMETESKYSSIRRNELHNLIFQISVDFLPHSINKTLFPLSQFVASSCIMILVNKITNSAKSIIRSIKATKAKAIHEILLSSKGNGEVKGLGRMRYMRDYPYYNRERVFPVTLETVRPCHIIGGGFPTTAQTLVKK